MSEQSEGHVDAEGGSVAALKLSVSEGFLWGVSFDGRVLSVGPSGGAWAGTLFEGLGLTLVAVSFLFSAYAPGTTFNGVKVQNNDPLVLLAVLIFLWTWATVWGRLRQKIVCSPDGITLRFGFFQSRDLSWSAVGRLSVASHRSRLSKYVSPISVQARINLVAEYDWPVVSTEYEAIAISGLATTSASEGWSTGDPSGAQQRVDILNRYRDSVAIEGPTIVVTEPAGPIVPRWLLSLVGVASIALLMIWAQS